jgi:hypothetical protein
MNWVGVYDVRYDNAGLTEASSKKFLEEVLAMVRRGIDRMRNFSTTSESSADSATRGSVVSSTPREKHPSLNLTRDMQ